MALSDRLKGVVAGGVAAAVLVGGTSWAVAAASDGGTVTACVHHRGGGLYEAKRCGKGDKRLKWGVTGPAGPAGASGAQGAAGTDGTDGTNGTNGTDGAPGPGAVADSLDTTSSGSHAITVGPATVVSTCGNAVGGYPAAQLDFHDSGSSSLYLRGTIDVDEPTDASHVSAQELSVTQNGSIDRADYSNGENMVSLERDSPLQTNYLEILGNSYSSSATPTSFQLHVLVTDETHTYIVDAAGFESGASCQLFTTVTPTNGDTAAVTS